MKFNPAHPAPCLYLKHGSYWYVKQGKWEKIGKALSEALEAYGRLQQKDNEGDLPALLERAYSHHKNVETLAAATLSQYDLALAVLKRKFRNFDAADLKMKHVAKLKVDGAKAGKPNITNRQLSLLRTLYAYLVEWQLVETNPAVGVKSLPEKKRSRYLTDTEFFILRNRAEPRLQIIMDLQYLTGQRIGSVLTIHRRDLTAEGIFFKPEKTKNSTGAKICVRWTEEMMVAVAQARELQGKVNSMWLFGSRTNKAPDYSTVAQQFRNAVKGSGVIDARPNDQRAKSLTDADQQGKDAQQLAAHSDPAMTKRYLRLFKTVLVEGPRFLDRR